MSYRVKRKIRQAQGGRIDLDAGIQQARSEISTLRNRIRELEEVIANFTKLKERGFPDQLRPTTSI